MESKHNGQKTEKNSLPGPPKPINHKEQIKMDEKAIKKPSGPFQLNQTLEKAVLPRPFSLAQNVFINGLLEQKAMLPRPQTLEHTQKGCFQDHMSIFEALYKVCF